MINRFQNRGLIKLELSSHVFITQQKKDKTKKESKKINEIHHSVFQN